MRLPLRAVPRLVGDLHASTVEARSPVAGRDAAAERYGAALSRLLHAQRSAAAARARGRSFPIRVTERRLKAATVEADTAFELLMLAAAEVAR